MEQPISFETLVDWVEGRLAHTDAQAVAALVSADPRLQAEVDWLHTFQQTAQQLVLEAPPPEVRAQLRQRFAAYAAANKPPTWREKIIARLKFDSRWQAVGVGARSLSPTDWQQIFATDDMDIALTLQARRGENALNLFGQILPHSGATPEAFHVRLFQAGQEQRAVITLEEGEFVLEALTAGDYELTFSNEQYHIAVPLQLTW